MSSYMLKSVSDNNLELANSWSNTLAKYNKLLSVMPYDIFRCAVYESLWRLTVGSHGVASVKGTLFLLMNDAEFVQVTIITVFLSDSAFKCTKRTELYVTSYTLVKLRENKGLHNLLHTSLDDCKYQIKYTNKPELCVPVSLVSYICNYEV